MTLLIISFIAGILTVAAPCILPLLPVIVGGSIVRDDAADRQKYWYRPLVIAASLGASVILFTLLLKASTVLLGVPQQVWQWLSGIIVLLFGINLVKPELWEKLPFVNKLNLGSNKLLGKSFGKHNLAGDVLIGMALGPVFSSCSPTYALVVASVLPASFVRGLVYLLAYTVGLTGMLVIIGYGGQALVRKLGWLTSGWFRHVVGILFIVVGMSVIFGLDKKVQTFVLNKGWYSPIEHLEQSLTR